MDILIPSLGDIEEVEVIELCVASGDVVAQDDTILVIESDKASMDIPAPSPGTITTIEVALGDMVSQGHLIARLDSSAAVVETPVDEEVEVAITASQTIEPEVAPQAIMGETTQMQILVPDIGDATGVVVIEVAVAAGDDVVIDDLLVVIESDKASMEITAEHAGSVVSVAVGEGQEVEQGSLIATLNIVAEISPAPEPLAAQTPSAPPSSPATTPPASTASQIQAIEPQTDNKAANVYAGPAVRRLARELGVELSGVTGTGNRNRITKDDVKAFVKKRLQGDVEKPGAGLPRVPDVDFSKFGDIEIMDLSRIQQRGAENLHRSWVNLPHVTQHDEADVTDMEEFRRSLKQEAQQKGIKLTPLSFLVKACCQALQEYPIFNASLAPNHKQLVLKRYINIGVAVDTPEGLVVPVIKAANRKTIWELSQDIAQLSEKARNKALGMEDIQGGTFSISSLGALGGTGFTPIVNAPEVAILGVANLHTKPIWDGQAFVPRKMLPLSLSYDHRVVNGADGGRFMLYLTSVLGDIRRMAL